ncbi:MAG TPA: ribbon-helix-helix protein, CopG family [Vicinamibacterales bacterium]|nr:ribbon-helix-helix protein, CopG family [Vicinamibacterales bacterium]
MKRTTIFIDEQLERELHALARRLGRPTAALVREAVERYVVSARADRPARLPFIAAGRSGRSDIATEHERLLFEESAPASRPRRPAAGPRSRRSTRRSR